MRTVFYGVVFVIVLFCSLPLQGQNKKGVRTITLEQLLGLGRKSSASAEATPATSYEQKAFSSGNKYLGLKEIDLSAGGALTQEMVSEPFTRYNVKATYDLKGVTVKMPEGTILDLSEGYLKNGALKFDGTLVGPVYSISKKERISNVKISGTYYETLLDLWGDTGELVFPWDTTAPKKVYMVDLKKFGITPGYQKKGSNGHYSDRQYDLMYNNGVGFTNAIQWAYKNGYDGIRFPKNDYCFTPRTVGEYNSPKCAQVLVQNLEKFDIDLGGGSYFNILDSGRKSRYYKASGEQYDQSSFMFWVACCINVSIHNGYLVGDRLIRDYTNPKEVNQEQTYGITVQAYSYNIRIHHIDASSFMGDGISMWQIGEYFDSYDSKMVTPGTHWVSVTFPKKYGLEGKIRNGESCTVSDFIEINRDSQNAIIKKVKSTNVFSLNNNRGYTRIPNVYQNVDILVFKGNKTDKPSRIIRSSYLNSFKLSPDERRIKLQFYYDEGVDDKGFRHTITVSDIVPGNCVIENCKIHNNHRGGITGGINHTVIRDSFFYKDLEAKNYKGLKVPVYTEGATNYHIDYEDSFGKGLSVYGCRFVSPRELTGRLLFGVLTLDFHDNVSDNPVIVYNNLFSNIYDNQFNNKSLGIAGWLLSDNVHNQNEYGCKYLTRVIHIHHNSISKLIEHRTDYRTFVFAHDNVLRR